MARAAPAGWVILRAGQLFSCWLPTSGFFFAHSVLPETKNLCKLVALAILGGVWVAVCWGGSWHLQGDVVELLGASLPLARREAHGWEALLPGRAGRLASLETHSPSKEQIPAGSGHSSSVRWGITEDLAWGRGRAGVELMPSGQSTPQIRNSLIFSTWRLMHSSCGQHERRSFPKVCAQDISTGLAAAEKKGTKEASGPS